MTSLKNVIEDIVVSEAIAQIEGLSFVAKKRKNLSEIAAFALNRLPPMYASTDRGWLQQRKRAYNDLHPKLKATVSQAIAGAKYDPLRHVAPLPEEEVKSPPHSLAKLQKLLCKPDLTWQDVPEAVTEALDKARREVDTSKLYTPKVQHQVTEIKDFLRRAKFNLLKSRSEKLDPVVDKNFAASSAKTEFEAYMLNTSYSFTNALEKLVIMQVEHQMEQISSILARSVRLEDAAAYALNRLPTMYATSAKGLLQQQQRAHTQLVDVISSNVIQALLTLGKAPRRLVGPLPFNKFDLDEEQCLNELKPILQRDEITWRNVVSLVEEALELAKGDADRLTQMLIQINNVFGVQLDDKDLSLVYDDLENVLTMKVLTKHAFWLLVDNPQVIAKDTLRIFPAIACIKLLSSMFTFPLTYTRQEMEEEEVL